MTPTKERLINGKTPYDQFTTVTYSGKTLLGKHSRDETGTWMIYGEDDNPDFAGHHHEPLLGHVTGKLDDVIRHAVSLDRFWTWGGGGRIEKIEIFQVDDSSILKIKELKRELTDLETQVKRVKDELKKYGVKSYTN
jgi:hypothetical protein